jgi:hypothetical protein
VTKDIEIKVVFRGPKYPAIVISGDRLYSATHPKVLASYLISSSPLENEHRIKIIDTTGEEFWYQPDDQVLSPVFPNTKWTKRRVIDLYNQSRNSAESGISYSTKSLSSKRLSSIISDICELI